MRQTGLAFLGLLLATVALSIPSQSVRAGSALGSAIQGSVPAGGGIALVVFAGGSVDALRDAARQQGCPLTAIYMPAGMELVVYIFGAVPAANAAFTEFFPTGTLAPNSAVMLNCERAISGPPVVALSV